jgi:hypothetical protein
MRMAHCRASAMRHIFDYVYTSEEGTTMGRGVMKVRYTYIPNQPL